MDAPSSSLFDALKAYFHQLTFLCLDPVHLVITFLQVNYRRRTRGLRYLRQVMNKLNKVDPAYSAVSWGPAYSGGPMELSQSESHMRQYIKTGSLPYPEAERISLTIRPDSPFSSRLEFIAAFASLTALFWTR